MDHGRSLRTAAGAGFSQVWPHRTRMDCTRFDAGSSHGFFVRRIFPNWICGGDFFLAYIVALAPVHTSYRISNSRMGGVVRLSGFVSRDVGLALLEEFSCRQPATGNWQFPNLKFPSTFPLVTPLCGSVGHPRNDPLPAAQRIPLEPAGRVAIPNDAAAPD